MTKGKKKAPKNKEIDPESSSVFTLFRSSVILTRKSFTSDVFNPLSQPEHHIRNEFSSFCYLNNRLTSIGNYDAFCHLFGRMMEPRDLATTSGFRMSHRAVLELFRGRVVGIRYYAYIMHICFVHLRAGPH